MKVIDTNEVNRDFRWYHRFIKWRYKRKCLKMFNKEAAKGAMASNEEYPPVFYQPPYVDYSGKKLRAAEDGIREAELQIHQKYKHEVGFGYDFWRRKEELL